MKIISIRENPEYKDKAIQYISSKWESVPVIVYEDSITHSLTTKSPLPQWYLMEKDGQIIGCAGLITNDFVSRMDLYPWVCALYIDENQRGNAYGAMLLEKAKEDSKHAGFENLYLTTALTGFYEKYGFRYIGQGYHPWNEESSIYEIRLKANEQTAGIEIRPEKKDELNEIYSLIQTAFETAQVKDGDEQDFAANLRKSDNYIPELALVAVADNKLVGHIMFTKTHVMQPDGSKFEGLLIAPVSVMLEYRSKGVGSALIEEGFRIARQLGYKAVFLVGNPSYYYRFGFKQSAFFGINPKAEIPKQFVMAYELEQKALDNVSGMLECC